MHCTYDRPEAVVSTLVDAVMARPANHDTVIKVIGTTKLCMFDVMGLRALPNRAGTNGNVRGPTACDFRAKSLWMCEAITLLLLADY